MQIAAAQGADPAQRPSLARELPGPPNAGGVGRRGPHFSYPRALSLATPARRSREEALEHAAFARSRTAVYVGRPVYFERLDAYVENAAVRAGLVVLGESGVGKTALLSNWAERYQREDPGLFLLAHFVGASPAGADWMMIVRRIASQLKNHFDIEEEIPDDEKDLRNVFPRFLKTAASQGKIVLIIDGLDQLTDREGARDLLWLPISLPTGCQLIVSTLPGQCLNELTRRDWPTLTVQSLQPDERHQFIQLYLAQYGKTLDAKNLARVVANPKSSNPLYLQALLEEVRIFGIYEQLDKRLDYYLDATSIENLFDRILERYESDYERDRPNLVRDALSLIWAARSGLSESELLDILGTDSAPLPQVFWSPLFLVAEKSFINRRGILNFFHAYLRRAVEQRYLSDDKQKKAAHLEIADYFESQPLENESYRKIEELPWQLNETAEWGRLKECVANLDIFNQISERGGRYELLRYWNVLSKHFDMLTVYRKSIDAAENAIRTRGSNGVVNLDLMKLADTIHSIGNFIGIVARRDGADTFFHRAKAMTDEQYANSTAGILEVLSDAASAGDEKAEKLLATLSDKAKHVSGSNLSNDPDLLKYRKQTDLAMERHYTGDNATAERLLREIIASKEQEFGPESTGDALNNLAVSSYSERRPGRRRTLLQACFGIHGKRPRIRTRGFGRCATQLGISTGSTA